MFSNKEIGINRRMYSVKEAKNNTDMVVGRFLSLTRVVSYESSVNDNFSHCTKHSG